MSTLPFQGGVIFRTFDPDSGFHTYVMFTAVVFYPKTVEITCPKLLGNLKKNCNPLENYKKMLTPSEIFLSQPPSEISTWYPLRNSEFQTPFGKSSQQGVWILNGMAQCTLGLYIC
jgi:hypothetical protein